MRVQVVLQPEEVERFRGQAMREGLSLSAWLRRAGNERLRAAPVEGRLDTAEGLQAFFGECAAREAGPESEPDWEDQKRLIEISKASGGSGT